MSFFPHTNTDVRHQCLADTPAADRHEIVLGEFRHADTDALFEYAQRRETASWASEYPHVIAVDGGVRFARVLKTVAYIVVDEQADGSALVEKWSIKGHRTFDISDLS